MKKIILAFVLCFTSIVAVAQTDGITYQAVIIDNNPQEIPGVDIPSNNLPNTQLRVRFSIIDNNNQTEYQEEQDTSTDAFGMINLTIGQGAVTAESSGNFNEIYWNNSKFLKVEIDLFDGNGMVEFSYQELTYLPYVKHREIIATSTLDVDGATNLNNSLSVNNASPTNLSGTLTVDQETNLNNNLTVQNQSPTHLTGDLTVDGVVSFDGELEVGGDTQLYSDLTVDGITNLNSTLNVNNGATTNLSGDLNVLGQATFGDGHFQNIQVDQNSNLNILDVDGASNLNSTLSVDGISTLNNALSVSGVSNLNNRVIINANISGSQNNATSYPLEVRGSNQGIWIDVDGGRQASKNFITFSDDFGQHGAIEGQTLSELHGSFRFIWDEAMAGLEQAFTLAEQIACGTQLDLAEAGVMLANNFVLGAAWIELTLNSENNVGVQFKTGGADYAEFLEKLNTNEQFEAGEIVGVNAGKISKVTQNAQHIMVISTNPIVLGNAPNGKDENNYEKVAFLGQVPVRVVGKVNIGDYILPSGNNDGIGIAKSPDKMDANDYKVIVGVAWEASRNDTFGYVNVAIGINSNDIALKVIQQEQELKALAQRLDNLEKRLNGESVVDFKHKTIVTKTKDSTTLAQILKTDSGLNQLNDISKADFEKWIADYGFIFEERMASLKTFLNQKGIDLSQYPEVQLLIENPTQALRDMHSGNYMPTLWQSFEKRYPKAFGN